MPSTLTSPSVRRTPPAPRIIPPTPPLLTPVAPPANCTLPVPAPSHIPSTLRPPAAPSQPPTPLSPTELARLITPAQLYRRLMPRILRAREAERRTGGRVRFPMCPMMERDARLARKYSAQALANKISGGGNFDGNLELGSCVHELESLEYLCKLPGDIMTT
ncbi:hypothetical protein B0H11DRAFT_1919049 [Mycena galericulata]|nr:hypothetical protein B0H11DRAFT_1919049 [Mycena galericulata]